MDGPRGPYGDVKPGAALAAERSGGVLVPMGSAVAHGKTFSRAWDRFALAWPFARVVVVLGAPIAAPAVATDGAVALRNAEANAVAAVRLAEMLSTSAESHVLSGMASTGSATADDVVRRN